MEKTFQISFTREIQPEEIESFYPEEENAPEEYPDETELTAVGNDKEEMYADLMNLFADFIKECGFENVHVEEVKECE